jgi:hypothetical protein
LSRDSSTLTLWQVNLIIEFLAVANVTTIQSSGVHTRGTKVGLSIACLAGSVAFKAAGALHLEEPCIANA